MAVECWESTLGAVLKGSWDLVTKFTNKATILVITYNTNYGTYKSSVLAKSHEPPSGSSVQGLGLGVYYSPIARRL